MRTSVMQVAVDLEQPLGARVERVASLVEQERGADLVLLPELWPHGAFAFDRWAEEAQPRNGALVERMCAAARSVDAVLHMGSFVEQAPNGSLYNCSALIARDGEILATYRKIHRFGFTEGEATVIEPGQDVIVHDGELGALGLTTCYDLRFPEMYRALVDRGTEVALVVAGWPAVRIAHWRVLAQARAVENQFFVVACNTAGEHAGVEMGGGSLVVDPWGRVLAEAGTGEEILRVDIDVTEVPKARDRFPVLKDRRLG